MLRDNMRERARIVTKRKAGTRTAGGYNKTPVTGPWFRADFSPGDEGEQVEPGGFRRVRSGATLECPARALDGTAIEIKGSDTVEVDSLSYGMLTMSIVGTPEKLMQGRVHVGWRLVVLKVDRAAAG